MYSRPVFVTSLLVQKVQRYFIQPSWYSFLTELCLIFFIEQHTGVMACQKFHRLLTRRWEMLDHGMKTVNAFTTVVNQDILWWVLRRGNASRVTGLQSRLTVLVSWVRVRRKQGRGFQCELQGRTSVTMLSKAYLCTSYVYFFCGQNLWEEQPLVSSCGCHNHSANKVSSIHSFRKSEIQQN